MPASTLRRTVLIWVSPSAPALSLSSSRRSGSSLPRFPSTSRFQHPPHLPRSGSLNLSGASLRHSLALTPFPLPFFLSPSFRRIFVASFSPHHSLAVILHHLPAVLTSRSTALRFNAGRVHGTPRRCQHTIRLLSTTPAADTASVYTTSPLPRSMSMYTCTGLFRAGVARSLRAMRRDRQRVGALCTVAYRSNLGRGSLPSLLFLSSAEPRSTSTCAFSR